MTCPACGADAPAAARFCQSCGQPLQARADERRIVTVLFADLVGFTGLSERMDPEQVKNLVDRCFERLVTDVARFGGRVDKIVGDAIVALFGAPVAHEDDAERAVRAGLAMRSTLAAVASEIGVDVRMRIGINTGEVLVGALRAGGDYTAMGDVVNASSRLQTAAEPGQILVGPETYVLTSRVVRYEPIGELQARNREQTIPAWAAVEAIAPPGSRATRLRSPLVGRDEELGLLRHALRLTVERARPSMLLVMGEAGMGKSRLAEELASEARNRHDALVLTGRCVPYGEANPWWPVAEAIREACGVLDTDPVEVALRKCREAVARAIGAGTEAPDVVHLADGLLYVLGHQRPDMSFENVDPLRARDEALRATRSFLEGLARTRPVMVVLSELHWADRGLLSAIDTFIGGIRGVRVAFVGTARPELQETWSPRPGRYNLTTVHLDPLGREAVEQLMAGLLGGDPPDPIRTFLLERSGGNPFFLEELVALMTEAGLGVAEDGRVRLEGVSDLRDVPPTLRGLVAARLDALPATDRSMLEDAAVVGRTGQIDAVVTLASARGESEPASVLERLAARDLLVVDEGAYSFKSDLVRDIAYETLTKAERARRHAAVGTWLDERVRGIDRTDEFLEQFAHHYGEAAAFARELGSVDGVPDDIRDRALDALERAAERAGRRETPRLAAHLLDHALALVDGEDGPPRRRLLLASARAQGAMRALDRCREDLDELLASAQRSDDRPMIGRALIVRGELEHHDGDPDRSRRTLHEALELLRGLGDDQGTADALRWLGETEMFHGRLEDAEVATTDAIGLFRRLGDRQGEAWGLRNIAWIAFMRGDLDLAERRLQDSATAFAEIDDRGGLGWAIGFLAWVNFMRGNLDAAETLIEPFQKEEGELGDPFAFGMLKVLRGHLRLWRGRHAEAIASLSDARKVFRKISDPWGELQALIPLAVALVGAGRTADGAALIDDILEVAPQIPDPRMRAFGASSAAGVHAYLGEAEPALRYAEAAVGAVTDEHGPGPGFAEGMRNRAIALMQLGRSAEARQILEAEHDGATTDGSRANVAGLLGLAYAAEGRPDDAVRAAAAIEAIEGGTYKDRTYAWIALGLAHAQRGDAAATQHAFETAAEVTDATGSVFDQAVVRLAHARALDALGLPAARDVMADALARFDGMGHAPGGWDRLFLVAAHGRGAESHVL